MTTPATELAPAALSAATEPRPEARVWRALAALGGPRALPALLAVVAFLVFLPALDNGFVEWDDSINLLENPHYRGLGWPQIRWMFTSTLMGHYIPVTWLSFGLDYTLWGMKPLGYHLTNNLLHAANTVLFYLIALRLLAAATGRAGAVRRLGAAMATLFFALHPLRAESVAWATERRDLLSGLFFLLTVLLYLGAVREEGATARRRRMAAALGCFALGLLSKSIIMTLPLLLLIVDVYPLGRLSWLPWRWRGPAARAVLREKAPFFALAAAGAAVSYWAVAHNDYITPLQQYPWPARVGMTFYSYWFYLWTTLWPSGLSPLYELPFTVDPLAPRFLGAAVGVAAVSVAVLALAALGGGAAPLAAWLFYGVFLGPVTGIVHSGHQLTHDRYSYLACLGFALLFGAAAMALAEHRLGRAVRPAIVRVAAAAAAAWILALGTLTWYQVQVWQDTESLWRHAIESDPDCSICHSNLGSYLMKAHAAYGPAREHLERTLALRPDRHRSRSNYGLTLAQLGETDRALEQLHLAVAHHPWDADALSNLGGALISKNRHVEARAYLERGLSAKPDHPVLLANMGAVLSATGQAEAALPYLVRSIDLKPDDPVTRLLLGRAYLALGDDERAGRAYLAIARLNNAATRRLAGGLVWL